MRYALLFFFFSLVSAVRVHSKAPGKVATKVGDAAVSESSAAVSKGSGSLIKAEAATESSAQAICVTLGFFVAGFVHGVSGFGCGLTAMAIVPTQLPMVDAVPVVSVLGLFVTVSLAVQLRAGLGNVRVIAALRVLIVGTAIGVPAGVYLLTIADPGFLRISLGLCMLIFVIERLLHECGCLLESSEATFSAVTASSPAPQAELEPTEDMPCNVVENYLEASMVRAPPASDSHGGWIDRYRVRSASVAHKEVDAHEVGWRHSRLIDNPLVGFQVGLVAGVLGGALNESGPPVVIFLALKSMDKNEIKATLQFYFACCNTLTVALLINRGILTTRHLYYESFGLPAAAVGMSLGVLLYNRMNQVTFARMIIVAMLLTGLAYITHEVDKIYVRGA